MQLGLRLPLLLTAALLLIVAPVALSWRSGHWLEATFGGGAVLLLLTALLLGPSKTPALIPHRPLSILLVEDAQLVLEFVMAALVEGGTTQVIAAQTKAEAEALLGSMAFDAALIDLGLPDGSGLDLIHQIRGGRYQGTPRGIPIVILSGIASLQANEVLQVSGADAFLIKPFLPAQVVTTLQRVLQARMN